MPQLPPPKRHPYDQWSPDARALDLVGDKWTLLIIRDLTSGPRRFVQLQRVLPGISTEQLRSRLNRMVADGLLTRTRYREVPPRVDYELTSSARDLMPVLGTLARWGHRWAWSPPRGGELVDIGAILRLAPGLVRPGEQPGVLQCTVTDGLRDGGPLTATVTLGQGTARVAEAPADAPDARITGSTQAWVAALGPERSAGALTIDGDRELAVGVITQLAGAVIPGAGIEPAVP